ncbi:MAG TPA: hypothetical protein VHM88_19245, partial [Candidatus Acidoferrales bacterium]|nr:hypothetical protein [Candidatus Acidoferrales bacterium]
MNRRNFLGWLAAAAVGQLRLGELAAQRKIERRSEIYPLVGPYRFALRKRFPTVYRYLNVVDIGHAELAEALVTSDGDEARSMHCIEDEVWNE